MKKLILLICVVVIYSCSSIRVATDYKTNFDFKNIKTYAFSKSGIDKAELNDIDKKRILKAIDVELYNKGLRKSSIEPRWCRPLEPTSPIYIEGRILTCSIPSNA